MLLTYFIFLNTFCYLAQTQIAINHLYAWNTIDFAWPSPLERENAINTGYYKPGNVVPYGIDVWKNYLYITTPRYMYGVPATVSYIDTSNTNENNAPLLIPYPSWEANNLPEYGADVQDDTLINVVFIDVDECNRLWTLDNGLLFNPNSGNMELFKVPTLSAYDLNTNQLIRLYKLRPDEYTTKSSIIYVKADANPNNCDETFVYITNDAEAVLIVYSWQLNDSWLIRQRYFQYEPNYSAFNINGTAISIHISLFGVELGPRASDGYRTMYFHSLTGTHEYQVSTRIITNRDLALDPQSDSYYQISGFRGSMTQSTTGIIDQKTGVLFLTQINRNGIGCWDTSKPLTPENFALITTDSGTMVFPNSIKIDSNRNMWILSNQLQITFVDGKFSDGDNFYVSTVPVDEAISNC